MLKKKQIKKPTPQANETQGRNCLFSMIFKNYFINK